MNEIEKMRYRIIQEIMERRDFVLDAIYEILINEDYDYVPDLFKTREDFDEFIEKWKPSKCCVKEEDND